MEILKRVSSGLAFLSLFLFFFFSKPIDLVKISKDDFSVWEILRSHQIAVVQELDSCFIARMERGLVSVLEKNHISYSILDRDIKDRQYLLVYSPSLEPSVLDRLRVLGQAVPVEKETLLFWTEKEDPNLLLPSKFERKALSSESILPYLETPYLSLPPGEKIIERRKNEVIRQIANEVSPQSLRYFVQSLQDFTTRYATTPNCDAAGQFIFNYFQYLGLETKFQAFTFGANYTSRNIIAELRGITYPEDIVIICAHYDSTSNLAPAIAPGADDDASGTAAVMEAARVLSKYPFDFSVRFIAFSAEEFGLYGSKAYASEARDRNERIIGVINLDMIAFADAMPEDLDIIVNPASEWLAEKVSLSSEAYALLIIRKIIKSSYPYSDHSPFWDRGYPALCGIEDDPLRNPYYHKVTDTVDKLNFDFFTSSTKAGLATLADLSQPLRAGYPETPKGFTANSKIISSLFSSIKNVTLSWDSVPGVVGYNVYRTGTSHLYYKKINNSLLSGTSFVDRNLKPELRYFYVLTAVDGGGLESNFSREAEALAFTSSSVSQALGSFFLLRLEQR